MNGRLQDSMLKMLLEQCANEKRNAHFYASLGNNMSVLGYEKSGKFFMDQYSEENGHFEKIWKYLIDRNSVATVYEIPEVQEVFEDVVVAYEKSLELEFKTSSEWNAIYEHAVALKDWNTMLLAQEFVAIQTKEEEEFMGFVDSLRLIGAGDTALLKLWDMNL